MPTLKKYHKYRLKKNKDGVDLIPVENIEVPLKVYEQYMEVKDVNTK